MACCGRNVWLFWVVVGLSLTAISCGRSSGQKACTTHDVCEIGQYCGSDNLCKKGCSDDSRCPEGQSCFANQCLPSVCGARAKPPTAEEQECYTGTAEELSHAKTGCKTGRRRCIRNGQAWSPCYGEQRPRDEICDQLDNNCNGQIDEGLDCRCSPGKWRLCHTSPPETKFFPDNPLSLCRSGVQYCETTGIWGMCQGEIKPHQSLQQLRDCFDVDGDCDGKLDVSDDCRCTKSGDVRDCYAGPPGTQGVGTCIKGRQTCQARCLVGEQTSCPTDSLVLQWSVCEGQILPIREEIKGCNLQDDDCNGQIDNGCSP